MLTTITIQVLFLLEANRFNQHQLPLFGNTGYEQIFTAIIKNFFFSCSHFIFSISRKGPAVISAEQSVASRDKLKTLTSTASESTLPKAQQHCPETMALTEPVFFNELFRFH